MIESILSDANLIFTVIDKNGNKEKINIPLECLAEKINTYLAEEIENLGLEPDDFSPVRLDIALGIGDPFCHKDLNALKFKEK